MVLVEFTNLDNKKPRYSRGLLLKVKSNQIFL